MPVTTSYPGLYFEELPSSARSIVAAPTSIAVFVGYTHPFKTRAFDVPVRIFSFSDYEREFGGIYISGEIDASVAHAVSQFFFNGGSDAYVVGLQPKYRSKTGKSETIIGATDTLRTEGGGIKFTALEPTDLPSTEMTVTFSNILEKKDTADFTITYGNRVETFRGLSLRSSKELEETINKESTLVRVMADIASGGYGKAFISQNEKSPNPLKLVEKSQSNLIGTFDAEDFTDVFKVDQPLDKIDVFNLLLVPGVSDHGVLSAALAFAERRQAFVIMDPPRNAVADGSAVSAASNERTMKDMFDDGVVAKGQNGAIYFPYLKSSHPLNGEPMELAPSGFVAGVYARTDLRRGVWKAPAGIEATVHNSTGVVESGRMTDKRQGVLNLAGVNCLRSFPGIGTVVFGARTTVSANPAFQQNKYVSVRRMTLFIEQSLRRNLKWIVFEPNDEPLWLAIRTTIEDFCLSLFNQGALQGEKPGEAFQVQCDRTTTTQADIDNGTVNIVVSFAPLKPAEFVIIKIAHLAGQSRA